MQTAPQPHGGKGVRKVDVVIDVEDGQVAREIQVKTASQTTHFGGTVARTPMTAPPDGQDFVRVQSPPATPCAQTVPAAGGATKVATQGNGQAAQRQDAVDAQGGVVAGSSRPTTVAAVAGRCGEDDDNEPLVNRQRWGTTPDGIENATKLWVDNMRFWNEAEGSGLFKLIEEAQLYLLAIGRGVTMLEIRRTEGGEKQGHQSAEHRLARHPRMNLKVPESLTGLPLRRYVLNHPTMDIVSVMWLGEDWCTCVSPIVCHITLDMDMKLPIWFVGAHNEDRHEDDELACYQEATMQRLVGAFTSTVSLGKAIDSGCISYERLRNIVDAMRLLLAESMWLMRMSRDDPRSHFDASLFVPLTTKPTLVVAMHQSFDGRRHILQAVTVMIERMGKPAMTLANPPSMRIPLQGYPP
ncbi:hypothetical protein CBR_g46860 [Chara braunii]|uniref:Uncharacterized protein n=1 Tax=Chara braunii TaxID=69332 RepID=A0A388M144_CHABU|nr:hypothetical protein CBR_g46860 [Chara braunii]|eukprot:GBG88294.1 hypothetical protein CBR_g46860 [Chara braunii]